jgi:hypothetical protein
MDEEQRATRGGNEMKSSLASSVLLVSLAALAAAGPAWGHSISDLAFMAGCWRGEAGPGGTMEERYSPPAGGMMLGTSQVVENGATRFYEFIRIEQVGEDVLMTPLPSGEPKPPFKLVLLEGKRAVFENRENDFPKRIVYHLTGEGTLVARIEGDEPERAREWTLRKCGDSPPTSG